MFPAARLIVVSAAAGLLSGCAIWGARKAAPSSPPAASATLTRTLAPSPFLIVGRILAVDPPRGLVFIEAGWESPAAAREEGTELLARTADFRETGRLRVSRYSRGRTIGATVVAGQPSPGDEVVWNAP